MLLTALTASGECLAANCEDCETERDEMRSQLWIHYGINAVLAVSLMMVICKDMKCCRGQSKHVLMTQVPSEDSKSESANGKVKSVILQSVAVEDRA